MLVLTNRLSLLASLLTVLAFSSPSPAYGAAIQVREAPTTTTTTDGTTITQSPFHQDRPSKLGLPDGVEPSSVASRKGMGNGRWNADKSHTHTWTGTWTGTKTGGWAKPTSQPSVGDDGGEAELSKRAHAAKSAKKASRRAHTRRGGSLKHGTAKHSRSVSIEDTDGEHYVVQKDKANTPAGKAAYSAEYKQRRFLMRRKNGTPGVINIMSHVYNADPGKKIASLFLEENQKGDASGYILNASEKDSSEIYLVPAAPSDGGSDVSNVGRRRSDDSSSKKDTLVNLRMEINKEPYCATYDPNPPEAEPLTMQPCMTDEDTPNGGKDSGKEAETGKITDPNNHKSQTFSFNPESGVIRPMWFAGEDDGRTDSMQAHASDDSDTSSSSSTASSSTVAAADTGATPSPSSVDSSTPSSTDTAQAADASTSSSSTSDTASAASPSATGTISAREPSSAQNVTLVFVPSSKPASAAADDTPSTTSGSIPTASGAASSDNTSDSSASAIPSASASAAGDDNSDSTMIYTKTVTVTSGATAASAADATGSAMMSTPTSDVSASAAADVDDGASSTTTITISASDLPSATAGPSQGSLNVQVVGDDGKTIGDDDPDTGDVLPSASASAGAAAETPSPTSSSSASGSAGDAAETSSPSSFPSISLTPVSAANEVDSGSVTSATPAYTSTVDPNAVASEVAQSWSASQSASAILAAADASATISSSASSAPPSPTSSTEPNSEVVAVKNRVINSRVVRRSPMMTPVSTAPYKWLFKLAGI